MAAGSGAAETQHRTEAREKQHLVELVAKLRARWAGENLIIGHLAVGVHGDINEQAVRQRKFEVLPFRRPGLRIVRKRNELGGAHEIESDVILDGANGGAGHDHLEDEDKHKYGGEESAGGRNAQRAENVVEKNLGAILYAAYAAGPIARMLRLSSGDFDADGKINRRNIPGDAGKQHCQPAETFEFLTANIAAFEMLPDLGTLCNARSAGDCIIEITRQIRSYCIALHWTPLPVELARGDIDSGDRIAVNSSEASETRRAAEKASPNGEGWASETLPCEDD